MINKVLVLGGSGYLGLHIAEFLKENGFPVCVGDIKKSGSPDLKYLEINVLDRNVVLKTIQDFDIVINCTGQITDPINTCFRLNTIGINHIHESIKLYNKKLIHISTVAVYGTTRFADESSDLNPESPYAACKAFAEYSLIRSLPVENYCILRLSNLFGEDQTRGFFAYLTRSQKSDRFLYFNNDGTLARYFLHVKDCSRAVQLAMQTNLSGIYNVSGTGKYSIKEVVNKVESVTRANFTVQYEKQRPIENIEELSSNLFMQRTGFSPSITIEDYIHSNFLINEKRD